MKTLYLDTLWGISGDMTIAAMLDLGLPFELLLENIIKIDISGYSLQQESVIRSGLRANMFIIELEDDHHDDHNHHHEHRNLNDILQLLEGSRLSTKIKNKAAQMFSLLAEAESVVHGVQVDKIHFHEVGALDSIIDIVGSCIAFDYFNAEKVICGKINLGGGFVNTSHGRLAVPPPAVTELCKGLPVFSDGSDMELTTPTGALIIRSFVTDFAPMPLMKLEKTGCGAGTREIAGHPNMLRIMLGEQDDSERNISEKITVLETEIDDMPAENFGYIMDKLLALPVLDVFFTPVHMKKNRPGTLITVLIEPHLTSKAAELMLRETSTFGVRHYETSRIILKRETVNIDTKYGKIAVKRGFLENKFIKASPEYEDCIKAAIKHNVPLREVQAEALRIFKEQENKK